MTFYTDKQTADDLQLLDWYRNNSVAHLFNQVVTAGGKRLLEAYFRQPMTSDSAINARSSLFRFFTGVDLLYPATTAAMETMEAYASSPAHGTRLQAGWEALSRRIMQVTVNDKAFVQLQEQVSTTLQVLQALRTLLPGLDAGSDSPYRSTLLRLRSFFAHEGLASILDKPVPTSFSLRQLAAYDGLLRHTLRQALAAVLSDLYELDVLLAVAKVAKQRGFSFAKALPREAHRLQLDGLFHPCLQNAIANDLHFDAQHNVLFLTGANMAGKSTLMKAFGCCMYLAHMGFPVPATHMEFSVKDGLYTSINVPDNISQGYSHFYAEVLRVKQVAEAVAAGKNMIVIFDELFKGTNVKDAYDATLVITEAFAAYTNCLFMISTHITEVGTALQAAIRNCWFAYLPTVMEGRMPVYTYRLQTGITSDKQGMIIIEKEGLAAIIREGMAIDA